ncbi:hypothetical protein QBC43DRAFT_334195 [Cladorrhinum sp. PSN259]|nr:hypothetical protein QBC43DRAFT_334195 [Cladorrhinum sp. PSN259]
MKHTVVIIAAIGLCIAATSNAASIPKRDPKLPPLSNLFNKHSPATGVLQNTAANVAGNIVGSLVAGEVANQVISQQQPPPPSVQRRKPFRGSRGNIGTNLIKGLANGGGSVLPAVVLGGVANQVLTETQTPTVASQEANAPQNQRRQFVPTSTPDTSNPEDLAALNELISALQEAMNNLPGGITTATAQKRQVFGQPTVSSEACRQLASCAGQERLDLDVRPQRVEAVDTAQPPSVVPRFSEDEALEEEVMKALQDMMLNDVPADEGGDELERRDPRIPIGPVVSAVVKFFGKQAAQEAVGQIVDGQNN